MCAYRWDHLMTFLQLVSTYKVCWKIIDFFLTKSEELDDTKLEKRIAADDEIIHHNPKIPKCKLNHCIGSILAYQGHFTFTVPRNFQTGCNHEKIIPGICATKKHLLTFYCLLVNF